MRNADQEMTVGKYPAQLLLDILSDGIEWSARGFWAQIERYRWYWWYVCDEDGEPDTDRINPALTADTVLLKMRDVEGIHEIYKFEDVNTDNVHAVEHRYDSGESVTLCGLHIPDMNTTVDVWEDECPEEVEDRECSTCANWVDITLNKLAEATTWALDNYNHLFSWYTNHQGFREEIDYDAVGADVIMQKMVLGEVVYG